MRTRYRLMLVPLLLCAAPALAQAPAPAPAPAAPQAPPEVQRALTDPATAEKLGNVMQALSKALLNLPVGEVEAAVEGRKPTAAERKLTVRDVGRREDRNFERNLQQQIANSRPMMEASLKALAEALPAMMRGMEEAGRSLERATSNMPSPTYPKR